MHLYLGRMFRTIQKYYGPMVSGKLSVGSVKESVKDMLRGPGPTANTIITSELHFVGTRTD